MFDVFSGVSDTLVEAVVVTPVAVNELALAARLILKGFDRAALAAPERPSTRSRSPQPS